MSLRLNDIKIEEHFNLIEFQCPCCHTVKLHPLLLKRAAWLRETLGLPLKVNSAYRCGGHNKTVGGAAESRHRHGRAIDVSMPRESQEEFRRMALFCGFERVILYPERGFAHIEI